MAGKRSASTTPQSHHSNNIQKTPSKHKPISLMNRLMAPISTLGGILQTSQPSSSSSSDHPVEVIGRIREHPEGPNKPSSLKVLQNGSSVRVRTDQGYRDFTLDGMSLAEDEDIQIFYKKYVESRIESVKAGGRCTVMMYGPTGAGKSHTMFGSAKEPGIAYRALQNILGETSESPEKKKMKSINGSPEGSGKKLRVIARVLEIYNEEIFDLLATTCPNTHNGPWMKSRARLEIMGKKVKNAISISGTDADQIAKEIVKVEKRRIVKSTLCNDRSSRSHCLVMLDVPTIGGRLVLVDMAGSENLEQAGMGTDLKMQTGKINQGNVALKRVVEAIANGDSYIPFRDSKLTMLLQDSFEDDEAKILMILCASPDLKDMHKTIGTLEYGCKAKCIIRLHMSPSKEKASAHERADSAVLEARLRAMEIYISKLEAENQNKENEKLELIKELSSLKEMLAKRKESNERCWKCCDDDLSDKIENTILERQRVAEEFIQSEKKKLEEKEKNLDIMYEKMQSQMRELEKEIEIFMKRIYTPSEIVDPVMHTDYDVSGKRENVFDESLNFQVNKEGKRISDEMASSPFIRNISVNTTDNSHESTLLNENATDNLNSGLINSEVLEEHQEPEHGWMPAIPEVPEEEEADIMTEDPVTNAVPFPGMSFSPHIAKQPSGNTNGILGGSNRSDVNVESNGHDGDTTAVSRRTRIENIFLLCGNRRELAAQKQQNEPIRGSTPVVNRQLGEETSTDHSSLPDKVTAKVMLDMRPAHILISKTKHMLSDTTPLHESAYEYSSPMSHIQKHIPYEPVEPSPLATSHGGPMEAAELSVDKCEVYVKWETSKDSGGRLIDTIRMKQDATLAELRREVEQHLSEEVKHDFTFLMLGDPTGSPVEREDEMQLLVTSLPDCHQQRGSKLACLRLQAKQNSTALPSPLCSKENQMNWNNHATPLHFPSSNVTSFHKLNDPNVVDCIQKSSNAQRHAFPSVSPVKGLRL